MTLRDGLQVFKRAIVLGAGCAYLFGFGFAIGRLMDVNPLVGQLITFVAAAVIMGVLTIFGERSLDKRDGDSRYSLSSLMLLLVPLAIYFAGARLFFLRLYRDIDTPVGWLLLIALTVIVMVLTTVLLMLMAEALIWLFVAVLRIVRARPSKLP